MSLSDHSSQIADHSSILQRQGSVIRELLLVNSIGQRNVIFLCNQPPGFFQETGKKPELEIDR